MFLFCLLKETSDAEKKFESFMKEIEEEMENQEDGEFFGMNQKNSLLFSLEKKFSLI